MLQCGVIQLEMCLLRMSVVAASMGRSKSIGKCVYYACRWLRLPWGEVIQLEVCMSVAASIGRSNVCRSTLVAGRINWQNREVILLGSVPLIVNVLR